MEERDYSKMKVSELKEELTKRGLPTSGSKDILIERLKKGNGDIESNSSSWEDLIEEEEEKLPDDLASMKVPELKGELKKRGLSVSGNKTILVQRLEAHINGDEPPEKKPSKPKRKTSDGEKETKKKRKKKSENSEDEDPPSTTKSNLADDFTIPQKQGNDIKIVSWNVAGFAAVMKKGFSDYLGQEKPDIICLNETKIRSIPDGNFPGYYCFTNPCIEKPGYSGVGLLTKIKPINVTMGIGVKEHDSEGRCITAEYDQFYLVATYIPNAGAKGETGWPKGLDYRMQWDVAFQEYLHKLDKIKPIIWCGDLNVAHTEIDLANPGTNKKTAGFTQKERDSFDKFLKTGFVDVHRRFNPNTRGCYSFWSYRKGAREKNVGWRLDYFIVSERIIMNISQSFFRSSVQGSDHCPICILIKT
jgi:AP endonuclease-1